MLDQAEIGRLRGRARDTLRGVLTDLEKVVDDFPVPDAQLERTARILDKLSEELAEAAGLLRRSGLHRVTT